VLADAHFCLAGVLASGGRLPAAELALRTALARLDGLKDGPGAAGRHESQRLVIRLQLAVILDRRGDFAPAAQLAAETHPSLARRPAQRPPAPDTLHELAWALTPLAHRRLARGEPARARPLLEQAVRLQRGALAQRPRHFAIRHFLGRHLRALALALERLG